MQGNSFVTDLTTEKFSDLVSKRHSCLVQLHKVGEKQSEIIASGEISSLLRLLAVKNQLIVALQSIEQQLSPFHDQNPAERKWATVEAHQNCSRQAAECKELLEKVMRLEHENEAKMTQRRDLIAKQLQTAQASSSARRAYQAHHASASVPHLPLATSPESPSYSTHLDLQTGP